MVALHEASASPTATLAGQVTVGLVSSFKVNEVLQVTLGFEPSLALQLAEAVPLPPDKERVAGEQLAARLFQQASVTEAVTDRDAEQRPPCSEVLTSLGSTQAIIGGAVSATVTAVVQVAVLPTPSIAVQVFEVVPRG